MPGDARACAFCQVVEGSSSAHVVFDDDVAVAFLDMAPVFKGHTLVVPRLHVETLTDVEPDDVAPLFTRVQRLASAVQRSMDAHGTFVAMNNTVSQSVPHLHVHVIPRRRKDGLRGFFWPRQRYASEAEAEAVADGIRAALR